MKKFYIKVTTDRGLEVRYASGRTILVPSGVSLFKPPPSFERDVRNLVDGVFDAQLKRGRIPSCDGLHSGKDNGEVYKFLVLEVATKHYWRVHASSGAVAWGYCTEEDGGRDRSTYLAGGLAACLSEHRGQGIYKALLKALRKHYGMVIMSDKTLSPMSLLVWASMGSYVGAQGRYRLNPKRRQSRPRRAPLRTWRGALQIALSEAAMGDRVA